jgi:predicted kinase
VTSPALVIVSGASGSGKSLLAPRLAAALLLPLIAKDDVKEGFYDGLGPPADRAESRRWGAAAYESLWRLVQRQIEVGVGAVVESNFGRGWAEPRLAPLAAQSRAAIVHCHTDRATLVRRWLDRLEGRADRHGGHVGDWTPADLRALLANPAGLAALDLRDEQPLALALPTLMVDTSDGYRPAFDEIVAWLADALR